MAVRTQPTLSPGYSVKLTGAMALSYSLFWKRLRSSYETPLSSLSLASSPTLPPRKRYRGTFELIADTETKSNESEDKGTNSKSEEAALKDQSHQAVPTEDTTKDEPLGLVYIAARRRALERAEDTVPSTFKDPEDDIVYMDNECDIPLVHSPVQTSPSPVGTPASPEWFLESQPVSSIVPSLVATPTPVAVLDAGDLLEIGAQLELHGSILYIHTERLDALPPTLFEGYGRDFIELFSRSAIVCEKILLQHMGGVYRRPESSSVAVYLLGSTRDLRFEETSRYKSARGAGAEEAHCRT
ncbi:hypothetical protein Tco_1353371 [Tanacetum coccineum]